MVDGLSPLSFAPPDINYIIIATDDEILPMFDAIDSIKAAYTTDQRNVLKTKIITAERIRKDF